MGSRPQIRKPEVERKEFYCTMCGHKYTVQKGNFYYSQSPLYAGNNKYMPICRKCVDALFEHYKETLGDEEEATKRTCSKLDMYFSHKVYEMTNKTNETMSRMASMVGKANIRQHSSKTFDDTLDEARTDAIESIDDAKDVEKNGGIKIANKTIKFFGLGYTPEEYQELQTEYDDWTSRHECNTKVQEEVFKNLCIASLNIRKAQQNGGKVSDAMRTFQDLLGTANLKPVQNSAVGQLDETSFGVLINKFENEDPIPEPEEEWKDVDGIVRYITVYFLGHLCKMMGLKNSYSKMYEDEMAQYKVERPEYENDDEALFDAVFNKGSGSS